MINVLITGAGSVMGQSIYQALNKSELRNELRVIFTNSDELGAGLYFNVQEQYKVDIVNTYIVPLAVDEGYITAIKKIIDDEKIDIVFSGTQHELEKIGSYNIGNCAVIHTDVIDVCLDKYKTFELFRKYNLNFPDTVHYKNFDAVKETVFPVVVKPMTDSSSRNIFTVNNVQELSDVGQNKSVDLDAMIVQEYLDGEEYTCGCYIDKYSKELSTIVFIRELTEDGASGYGEVVHDDAIEAYLFDVCNMLQENGLVYGHVNVQLRMVNGSPVCFEINPRLSSTESPKASLGFNSVEAYISNIVKEESCTGLAANPGKFLRYYEDVILT